MMTRRQITFMGWLLLLLLEIGTTLSLAREATATFEGQIITRENAARLDEILVIADLDNEVYDVAFNPVELIVAIVTANSLTIWDLQDRQAISQFPIEAYLGSSAAFDATNSKLLIISSQSLYLWSDYRDMESELELTLEATLHASAITDAYFSQDSSKIVAVRAQIGGIYRWNANTGELLQEQYFDFDEDNSAQFSILSTTGVLNGIAKNHGVVEIRETQRGELLSTIYFEVIFNEETFIHPLAFSSDDQLLLIDGRTAIGNSIILLEVDKDESFSQFEHEHGSIWAGTFSPNRELIALGNRENGEIYIWNSETGEELAVLTGHTEWITSLSFNADGTLLMSSSTDGTVRLWGVPAGE